ncbi:MAG: transcription antitermination factor NusB [Gammaproteobacteria bacterium]|nr:transcription antitermination factor NusB [Gammaproteobacteria bacterium]
MPNKSKSRFESRRRARRRALQALYQWHLTGQGVGEILDQFQEEQDFSNVDSELFANLVRKVSKDQAAIDEKIQPFLDRPVAQLDVIEHVILSMGAYELLYSIEVPHQVVIDEAINLAKQFGAEQGHSFVNGVLDKAAKQWRDPASLSPFSSG